MRYFICLFGSAILFNLIDSTQGVAEQCTSLNVFISGSLPADARIQNPSDLNADLAGRPALEIPLTSIGAADARLEVRLSRTEKRIWVVEMISSNREYPSDDQQFQLTPLRIDLDDNGRQEAPQRLSTLVLSNAVDARPVYVSVVINNLRTVAMNAGLTIQRVEKHTEECRVDGSVESSDLVGDQAPVVTYYAPGEGEIAILNEANR